MLKILNFYDCNSKKICNFEIELNIRTLPLPAPWQSNKK